MPEQYFAKTPACESRPAAAKAEYRGKTLVFTTDSGVFSRGEMDAGTRILLAALPEEIAGRVLDLGCGWGAAGVCVGAVYPGVSITFTDINERAVALAQRNAQANGVDGAFYTGDGCEGVPQGVFDFILLNPPIRAGKQVIYRLFAECAARLASDGALYIVIRRQQGAESALKYLGSIYTEASVIEKSGGYWVIRCNGGKTNAV